MIDYSSKNYKDIVEFYNSFETKEGIIAWMQNREKAKANIVEYKSKDNYAIVVIPTIDADGEWATIDRKIFKGLHIIFIENEGKKPNKFFNYSYSINSWYYYDSVIILCSWLLQAFPNPPLRLNLSTQD